MKKKINNLKQLRQEQHRLKIKAEASKQLFFESFGETRRGATGLLFSRVLLPAGAAGLTAWGAKKIFGSNGEEAGENGHDESPNVLLSLLPKLLPLGISLINTYLAKQAVEEAGVN